MGRPTVTVIPGDGVGPEVTDATVRILEAAGAKIDWEWVEAGAGAVELHGSAIPPAVIESIKRNRVALKARLSARVAPNVESPNVTLRKALDLYANVRPVRNFVGHKARYENVDLVIVRENTEGEYASIEHRVVPGVVETIKLTTRRACERIARFAFDYAVKRGRQKVTAIHKANIMKISDGLFLQCCREVAKGYPSIQFNDLIVDSASMQLVLNPYQFDVIVTENFYGDLVSSLCAGLVGGIGVVPGCNFGEDCAVFEAIHGDVPEMAGKGLANPTILLVPALFMLRHLGMDDVALRIERATGRVLQAGEAVTPDLGGRAGTRRMADAIINALDQP